MDFAFLLTRTQLENTKLFFAFERYLLPILNIVEYNSVSSVRWSERARFSAIILSGSEKTHAQYSEG